MCIYIYIFTVRAIVRVRVWMAFCRRVCLCIVFEHNCTLCRIIAHHYTLLHAIMHKITHHFTLTHYSGLLGTIAAKLGTKTESLRNTHK